MASGEWLCALVAPVFRPAAVVFGPPDLCRLEKISRLVFNEMNRFLVASMSIRKSRLVAGKTKSDTRENLRLEQVPSVCLQWFRCGSNKWNLRLREMWTAGASSQQDAGELRNVCHLARVPIVCFVGDTRKITRHVCRVISGSWRFDAGCLRPTEMHKLGRARSER